MPYQTTLKLISNLTLYKAYIDALKLNVSEDFMQILLEEMKSRSMPLPITLQDKSF
ncbi:sporulation histidine kinase inhibitor Sda [Metabacillus halosaccharovorans]|uniref:Sporulation histidine kinase inhibitor Sda n=1 Tax=Metabacillus halosaccharovorans TaxID=930124 RepID=A0ABT3DH23_9BACI|nr:sporulation histidine kinase inhibitor Sda [Metabacillus halosaccharovorans]MCV9886365.1 sporulation histidine kinase inhibitor Sda [Metabacillus halosaccharovorans]